MRGIGLPEAVWQVACDYLDSRALGRLCSVKALRATVQGSPAFGTLLKPCRAWGSVFYRPPVNSVAALRNGDFVCAIGDKLVVRDAANRRSLVERRCIPSEGIDSCDCLAVLPDGRVAVGCMTARIHVWHIARGGGSMHTLEGHEGDIYCIAALAGGHIITGSADMTLKVWDVDESRCVQTLFGHEGSVLSVAALPGGNVVSGSQGLGSPSALKLWDPSDGSCLETLTGHWGGIDCVAALPNGCIVSGSSDKTLRVWDLTTGLCLRTLRGHESTISCVAVLEDGRVASGDRGGRVKVWDVTQSTQSTDEDSEWPLAVGDRVVGRYGRTYHGGTVESVSLDDQSATVRLDVTEYGFFSGQVRRFESEDLRQQRPSESNRCCLQTLRVHDDATVYSLAPLADGCLVSGDYSGRVMKWAPVRPQYS